MVFGFFKKSRKDQSSPPGKSKKQILEELSSQFAPIARSAVHLSPSGNGSSWLGGLPKVDHTDFVWPENEGRAMEFLAQLDLASIQATQACDWLPATGNLLFFYDAESFAWGGEPEDKHTFKVIRTQNPEHEIPAPENLEVTHDRVSVSFHATISYPDPEEAIMTGIEFSEEEANVYAEHFATIPDEGNMHQISGYPMLIQGDNFPLQASQVSRGEKIDYSIDQDETKKARMEEDHWQLLFQIDSCQEPEFQWGDGGCLYYYIKKEDARQGHFDQAWMFLSCY